MKEVTRRPSDRPELSDQQKADLKRLAAMNDEDIDTSDAPELGDEVWANAARGRFYRPIKEQITARIDADVLAWLKADGKGYQTRMNAILRKAMLEAAER